MASEKQISPITRVTKISNKSLEFITSEQIDGHYESHNLLREYEKGVNHQGRNYKLQSWCEAHPALAAIPGFTAAFLNFSDKNSKIAAFCQEVLTGFGRSLSAHMNGVTHKFEAVAIKKLSQSHEHARERLQQLRQLFESIIHQSINLLKAAAGN